MKTKKHVSTESSKPLLRACTEPQPITMRLKDHRTDEDYCNYASPTPAQLNQLRRSTIEGFAYPVFENVGSAHDLTIPQPKIYLGIDGGSSGGYASTRDFVNWDVRPVAKLQIRGHWVLSIGENLNYLQSIVMKAGGVGNIVVVYEQTRKNPRFGIKNSFVGGRNEEFWRVLLTMEKITFASVDPKTWQSECFQGINLPKPKDRAREYIRRNCPNSQWLERFNRAPREAFVDAMCIAFWGRQKYQETGGDQLAWSGGLA